MAVLNVLCVSTEDFARNLGKRTDDRDVESYIHKEMRNEQQDALTFLRPRKHPERIRKLGPTLNTLNVISIFLGDRNLPSQEIVESDDTNEALGPGVHQAHQACG